MNKEQTINAIAGYLSAYPVSRVSLFGSYARNQDTPESDIDLLIQFSEVIDLFTLALIRQDLCDLTHRQIDIITEKSLSPMFKSKIQNDLQVIYQV